MDKFKLYKIILPCLIILAGCGNTAGEPVQYSTNVEPELGSSEPCSIEDTLTERRSESVQTAYDALLSGDISLFDSEEIDTWGLDTWKDTILSYGELEYTYLDLDGDGVDELLIQMVNDPCGYNSVFHYDGGKLYCWQYDHMEGNCRDYPLKDGTMVRQYDFNGTYSYTIFRYQGNGETETIFSLFAREELISEDSASPCPYYEINGNEVDKAKFDEQINNLIINQMLERSAWTTL